MTDVPCNKRTVPFLAAFADRLINLLFPRRCPVCGGIVWPEGALICPGCITKLSPVRQPVCQKCGKEVLSEGIEYCADCSRHRRTYDSGMALLNYNEAARHSMAAIKYKNKREYLDFYAAAMGTRMTRRVQVWQAAALVPVPVHPARLRKRGYNQARELAVRLSRIWGIPVDDRLLIRTRKTAPQRTLNPRERLENLQEAFSVRTDPMAWGHIPGSVILVDDIYTTGSTIEACSRVLKAAGVERIYYVAVCIGYGR